MVDVIKVVDDLLASGNEAHNPMHSFSSGAQLSLIYVLHWCHCWSGLLRPAKQALCNRPMLCSPFAGVPVTVYNGQLDLICCMLGTDAWMDQLKWKGLRAFRAASPEPFYVKGERTETAGFFKAHKNLAMYIVLNAGHMIPSDQPKAALLMLEHIMSRGERVGLGFA